MNQVHHFFKVLVFTGLPYFLAFAAIMSFYSSIFLANLFASAFSIEFIICSYLTAYFYVQSLALLLLSSYLFINWTAISGTKGSLKSGYAMMVTTASNTCLKVCYESQTSSLNILIFTRPISSKFGWNILVLNSTWGGTAGYSGGI